MQLPCPTRTISFVDHETLVSEDLGRIASYLNDGKNALFPDGVNVSFVEILSEDEIFVRTYERGVGYTNACGTAMSASSLMYVLEKTDGKGFEKTLSVKILAAWSKRSFIEKKTGTTSCL